MKKYTIGMLVVICIILSSCAGSYTRLYPKNISYSTTSGTDGLLYSYRYNILSETGNKKYANKELKKGIKLLAVKLQNTSDKSIVFKNDVDMFMGNDLVLPMEPRLVHQQIKQPAGLYMLWSLLWVVITKCGL